MTLKEYFNKLKKEDIYLFYSKVIKDAKDIKSLTKQNMYDGIIALYNEDPEIILNLCTFEEIAILKEIVNDEFKSINGYIEYIMLERLKSNYLVLKDKDYYIPEDIFNYVKMALNLLDKEYYRYKDLTDSVIIGLVRIYNVLEIDVFNELLLFYNIKIDNLKKYIFNNPKFKNVIDIKKNNNEEFIVSLENYFYQDVLKLLKDGINLNKYKFEEVISYGKYKINLFKEDVFNYLSFLEMHLDNLYIDMIFKELTIYMGFDIDDEETLNKITDNILELHNETKKVLQYFPIWIYKGNNLNSLKENVILPNKNDLCICGSNKKYKKCCGKKIKK